MPRLLRNRSLPLGTFLLFVAATTTAAFHYACSSDSSPAASSGGPSPTPTNTTGATSTVPPPVTTGTGTPPGPDGEAPDGASEAGGGPQFPPSLAAKLVLWLQASGGYASVDGGALWTDNSPHHNDAIQLTPANTPVFLDAGSEAGLATRDAVHFTGDSFLQIPDTDASAGSLQWAADDFAIYTVVRHLNAAANYALLYAKWTDISPYPGIFLWASYPGGPGTGYVTRLEIGGEIYSDGGLNDNQLRVVGARKNGNHLELRINGQVVGERPDASGYDLAGFNAQGLPAYIGGRPGGGFQDLLGDLAEVVGIKGTVSDDDTASLESYLKAKYGL